MLRDMPSTDAVKIEKICVYKRHRSSVWIPRLLVKISYEILTQ